jgi:hypothetical protein
MIRAPRDLEDSFLWTTQDSVMAAVVSNQEDSWLVNKTTVENNRNFHIQS